MQNTVYPPTRGTVRMNPRTTLGGLPSMTTKQLSSRICEDLVADLMLPMKDTSSWFCRPNTLGQLREYTQVQLVALTALPSPRYSCCQESRNSVASAEAATGTNDYNKVWDMDTWIVGIGVNPLLSPPKPSQQLRRERSHHLPLRSLQVERLCTSGQLASSHNLSYYISDYKTGKANGQWWVWRYNWVWKKITF